MRLVISGAKGYVGSVLSLRAIERGHEVLALDDESRGLNPIEDKIGDAYRKFDCREGILDAACDRDWMQVDSVIHLAAATGSLDRPLDELLDLNVVMTQRVYEDTLRLGAKTFFWPTTSLALEVPDSPYVESKERALAWLREVDQLTHVSRPVRFFNLAGAYKGLTEKRKAEVHLIPTMLKAYRERKPFVINGDDYDTIDGTPSRPFVHILDCVEYLLDLIEAPDTSDIALPHGETGIGMLDPSGNQLMEAPGDGAIWLGHDRPTTVKQAVALFEQFMGPLQVSVGPRRPFDCGALRCAVGQAIQFEAQRGYALAPAWVTFRDELEALRDWNEPSQTAVVDEPIVEAVKIRQS